MAKPIKRESFITAEGKEINQEIYQFQIMKYYSSLLLSSLMLVTCSVPTGIDHMPEDIDEPGWHEGTLEQDGLERLFRFYIPDKLLSEAPVDFNFTGALKE